MRFLPLSKYWRPISIAAFFGVFPLGAGYGTEPYTATDAYKEERVYYSALPSASAHPSARPHSCLALSGGGLRAALTSLGFLKSLSPNLLPNFDIISAVSGSSWSVTMLVGEALQQEDHSIPNLLAEGKIGQIDNGVSILNFRSPRPSVIATSISSFFKTTIGFNSFLDGLGHSEFLEKTDFTNYDALAMSPYLYKQLHFPYISFGSTAVAIADSAATKIHVNGDEIFRKDLFLGNRTITANIARSNMSNKLLIGFQPISSEYFEITPLSIGSPLHGYTNRPSDISPLVATSISSAGLDYIHPDGSLGIIDSSVFRLLDLATQYRFDDPEVSFHNSLIWSFLKSGVHPELGFDSRSNDRVVDFDVDLILSDGGHSDKLGIVPLLWRECTHIIALDMGEDPNFTFSDEINLVRRVNADPYVNGKLSWSVPDLTKQIDSDAGEMRLCRINDPNCRDPVSEIKVIKLAFRGCDSEGIVKNKYSYLCHRYDSTLRGTFPHEAVSILHYDNDRVKAYQELGEWLAEKHTNSVSWALQ